MDYSSQDGKFTQEDVADLRSELLGSGLDHWQAAELVTSFMAARGYGVSAEGARSVASGLDATQVSLEIMHQRMEQIALVM